jgi:hypothetical protein
MSMSMLCAGSHVSCIVRSSWMLGRSHSESASNGCIWLALEECRYDKKIYRRVDCGVGMLKGSVGYEFRCARVYNVVGRLLTLSWI